MAFTLFRTSAAEAMQAIHEGMYDAGRTHEEWERHQEREPLIFKGYATKVQAMWTTTLRSIHLNEGFIPIPKAMRGVYPPLMPGEEAVSVLKGLWYDDATAMWIWLDRVHHRFYGPDLLDTIGFLSAGIKLKIEWNADGIVLYEVGHDQEVQQEETRLVDLEELRRLRGTIGEGYRQAMQAVLLAAPEGLIFKEILVALRERQRHEVRRSTVRSILSSGGCIQRGQRWYAAPDSALGAKKLKEALLETLIEPNEQDGQPIVLSHQEYLRTRAAAIHKRLQEITNMLHE